MTDPEIGAVASVLPPAEACRFLVDLANLRGGPDNITVIIVKILSGTDGDKGSAVAGGRKFPRPPWWVLSLIGGTVLALGATLLHQAGLPSLAVGVFLPAVVAVLTGIVGLFIYYKREQVRQANEDENRPPPKAHRRRPCKIDKPLLTRLTRASRRSGTSRRRAAGRSTGSRRRSTRRRARSAPANDLPGAFREYCRAMQPLMRALHDRPGRAASRHLNRAVKRFPRDPLRASDRRIRPQLNAPATYSWVVFSRGFVNISPDGPFSTRNPVRPPLVVSTT